MKVEEEIKIKAKQVTNNLVSFMKELDTEANKQIKELEYDIKYYKSKIEELEQQTEKMKCCGNCSKYDRNNRMCSRTKFSVIETLYNCTNDWELRK